MSDIDHDLELIADQERLLRFEHLDEDVTWALGNSIRDAALAKGVAVAIEIRLARETVFFCCMRGTVPAHADWARRKRNAVELLRQSSYAIGLEAKRDGSSPIDKMALSPRDHVAHGGSFPLRLRGGQCVGVVTVSGLPQRADHILVVDVLAAFCGVALAGVQLTP